MFDEIPIGDLKWMSGNYKWLDLKFRFNISLLLQIIETLMDGD